MVEEGITELDAALKERVTTLKACRDAAAAALTRLHSNTRDNVRLGPEVIGHFVDVMQERPSTGDASFRKAEIASFIDRIEVDDAQIRICERKDVLERSIVAGAKPTAPVLSLVSQFFAELAGGLCGVGWGTLRSWLGD